MPPFRNDAKGGGRGIHPRNDSCCGKPPAGSASGEGDGSEPAFGGKGRRLGKRAAKGAGGKRRQGIDRGGGIGAGAGQGFGQGAVPLDKPQSTFEIARALLALFQCAPPEGALLAVAARISEDDRQGDLAVAEIVADRFAEFA